MPFKNKFWARLKNLAGFLPPARSSRRPDWIDRLTWAGRLLGMIWAWRWLIQIVVMVLRN